MNPILEINEPDFEREVLKYTLTVLVSFWAPWSQPCGRIGPVLDEVAARCNGTARVVKVNVDDNPDLGLRFVIQSIPTLLYFFHGKVSAKIIGTASKEAILAKLPFTTSPTRARNGQSHSSLTYHETHNGSLAIHPHIASGLLAQARRRFSGESGSATRRAGRGGEDDDSNW